MASVLEVMKCELCGHIAELVHAGTGTLVCCGQPMKKLEEKTADRATEKHVPVIETVPGGYKVVVGTTRHPMEPDHHIEWIELLTGAQAYRRFLKPGDAPEATFQTEAKTVTAREHCNKHGLWRS